MTLTDYRTRFAQYRADPDLQTAHLQHPFICVWDDHEVANDSFEGGAENHDPETEGDFALRRANAVRAWHEWMPIRDREDETIHRALVFGDLAELVLLDTRLEETSTNGMATATRAPGT